MMIHCIRKRYPGYLYTGVWKSFLKKIVKCEPSSSNLSSMSNFHTLFFLSMSIWLNFFTIMRYEATTIKSQKPECIRILSVSRCPILWMTNLTINMWMKNPGTFSGVNQDSNSSNYVLVIEIPLQFQKICFGFQFFKNLKNIVGRQIHCCTVTNSLLWSS